MNGKMKIALIAHDGKKADMVAFVMKRLEFFREIEVVATVIFFIDPLDVHPHQVDVNMLLRICNVYNVPLATNYATASMVIKSLIN